jgi:HlyD family secretion protein
VGRPTGIAALLGVQPAHHAADHGTLARISPDTTTDQRTGKSYSTARIATTHADIARLGEVKLVAGMPVESFIKTQDRSVMSYFVKPLSDQISRAFRE